MVKKEIKKVKNTDNDKKNNSSTAHRSQNLTKELIQKKDLPSETKDNELKFDDAMKKIDIISNKIN